jgi:hypothetical protein
VAQPALKETGTPARGLTLQSAAVLVLVVVIAPAGLAMAIAIVAITVVVTIWAVIRGYDATGDACA